MHSAPQNQTIALEIACAVTINSPHKMDWVAKNGSESLFDVVTLILTKVFDSCINFHIKIDVDNKLMLLRACQVCGLEELSRSVFNRTLQTAYGFTVARTRKKTFIK